MTGGVENGAVVGLQDRQPIAEIVGMAYWWDDPKMGAKKGAGQFGNEFFARIGGSNQSARSGRASSAGWMGGPVVEFMQRGAVEIDRGEKAALLREANEICRPYDKKPVRRPAG